MDIYGKKNKANSLLLKPIGAILTGALGAILATVVLTLLKTKVFPRYVPDSAYCWNNHYYAFFENCYSWEDAKEYCESLGGHLATILSDEEDRAVYSFLLDSGYDSAYFGLSDNIQEGHWYWVTGDVLEYQNWSVNQPNNQPGKGLSNEDYAMYYYKFNDGSWNDGDFGKNTFNSGKVFICEWE